MHFIFHSGFFIAPESLPDVANPQLESYNHNGFGPGGPFNAGQNCEFRLDRTSEIRRFSIADALLMKLEFLPQSYAICRLKPDAEIPAWCTGSFFAIVRTSDELSLVVASETIPDKLDIKIQDDFCCFRVIGELEFDVIGVIAKISQSLAEAQIPILSISTFNTDYFLVANAHQDRARIALQLAGYEFEKA